MKGWSLSLFAGLLLLTSSAFALNDVRFDGSAGWAINSDQCTFTVNGITNNSAAGSKSGTLRLVLWVTKSAFPSSGYRVATYDLGQLSGGYRFGSFKATRPCSLPSVTGFYYFTVSLEQYDGSWKTSDYRAAGSKYLDKGKFASVPETERWSPPEKPIKNPKANLRVGDELTLTLQTTDGVNYVPKGTVLRLRIKIQANGKTTVYGGSRPEGAPAKFTYKVRSESYKGKKVKVGRLFLDYAVGEYAGMVANSQIRLFFQSASGGFYKSADKDPNGGGKSGGVFQLK